MNYEEYKLWQLLTKLVYLFVYLFLLRLVRRLIASWNHWVSRSIQPRFKWKKYVNVFTVRLIPACSLLTVLCLFQVDMDALMHMTDDDLKALLIPMVKVHNKLPYDLFSPCFFKLGLLVL